MPLLACLGHKHAEDASAWAHIQKYLVFEEMPIVKHGVVVCKGTYVILQHLFMDAKVGIRVFGCHVLNIGQFVASAAAIFTQVLRPLRPLPFLLSPFYFHEVEKVAQHCQEVYTAPKYPQISQTQCNSYQNT